MKPAKIIHLRILLAAMAALVAIVSLARCGSSNKPKNSSNPPATVMGELPADWDARSDWNGSPWSIENP